MGESARAGLGRRQRSNGGGQTPLPGVSSSFQQLPPAPSSFQQLPAASSSFQQLPVAPIWRQPREGSEGP
eukprot:12568047-Alexandrium_andersonii.AAC.1